MDVDVLVNDQDWKWGIGEKDNLVRADFRQVLLHELGHFVGLSHTAIVESNLYPSLPAKIKHTLHKDEKKGAKFLYDLPATGLEVVSPIPSAIYPNTVVAWGLPIPVFRWTGSGSFVLEFSATKDFKKKISFNASSQTTYAPSASDFNKIMSLAAPKVYWRVVSGSTITTPRALKFKAIV
jgi:hypothetical protein